MTACAYGARPCRHQSDVATLRREAASQLHKAGYGAELQHEDPLVVVTRAFESLQAFQQRPAVQLAPALAQSLRQVVDMELDRAKKAFRNAPDWKKAWERAEPRRHRAITRAHYLLMPLEDQDAQA